MISLKKARGWIGATALFVSLGAIASPVTWTASGSINTIQNPAADLPGFIHVGSTYNLSVSFDPATFGVGPNCIAGPLGGCIAAFPANGLIAPSISVDFGTDCSGDPGYQACGNDAGPQVFSTVLLYNDYWTPGLDPFDAISFIVYPDGNSPVNPGQRWQLTFYAPTDTFGAMPPAVPGVLDPRFTYHDLRVCDQPSTFMIGSPCNTEAAPSQLIIGSGGYRNVPEPATLALLGMGLAGLGFARRKRKA